MAKTSVMVGAMQDKRTNMTGILMGAAALHPGGVPSVTDGCEIAEVDV